MSGKPRSDRSSVKVKHLGLKLTAAERAQLQKLVAHYGRMVSESGIPGKVTASAVIRHLIASAARDVKKGPA